MLRIKVTIIDPAIKNSVIWKKAVDRNVNICDLMFLGNIVRDYMTEKILNCVGLRNQNLLCNNDGSKKLFLHCELSWIRQKIMSILFHWEAQTFISLKFLKLFLKTNTPRCSYSLTSGEILFGRSHWMKCEIARLAQLLTISAKRSILNVWQNFEYTPPFFWSKPNKSCTDFDIHLSPGSSKQPLATGFGHDVPNECLLKTRNFRRVQMLGFAKYFWKSIRLSPTKNQEELQNFRFVCNMTKMSTGILN